MTRGVVWVVVGARARELLPRARGALEEFCPGLPHIVIEEPRSPVPDATDLQLSRWGKLSLLDESPFDYTAYLDVDTQLYRDIGPGFDILADGWDIAIAPSQNQSDDDLLWHIGSADKKLTLRTLMYTPLQLQAGVMFVSRNSRTQELFSIWQEEWMSFQDQDQGALLRALQRVPVKLWLLGRPWNGGYIIGHRFGDLHR